MTISDLLNQHQFVRESLLYLHHSKRNQARILNEWISKLMTQAEAQQVSNFLRESVAQLLLVIPTLPVIGSEPEFFSGISKTLATVQSRFAGLFEPQEIATARQRLKLLERTVHAFLGQPVADSIYAAEVSPFLFPGMTERDRLKALISFLSAKDDAAMNEYGRILHEWDALVACRDGCVNIPLIEHDLTKGEIKDFHPYGSIATLVTTISRIDNKSSKDVIRFAGAHEQNPVEMEENELQRVLDAIRQTAPQLINGFVSSSYALTVGYSDTSLEYTGRSLGLGAAVSAMAILSTQMDDRSFSTARSDAVFTGCIDSDSNIHPIDENQIVQKVKAVFFSPFAALVIPKANEAEAQETLDQLHESYPSRRLELIPVRTLKDVFANRIAIDQKQRTVVQRVGRKAKAHQTKITVMALVVIVLMVAGYLLLGVDWDRNPADVKMDGNYYHIRNKKGNELWTKMIGTESQQFSNTELKRWLDQHGNVKTWVIYDLNNDGKNEVLITHPVDVKGYGNRLDCYNSDGTLKWQRPLGKSIVTTDENYSDELYRIASIWVGVLDSTATPKIITLLNAVFDFQSFVNILDAGGNPQSEYFHTGLLNRFTVREDTGTSRKAIFLSGTNNSFNSPVLAVLDPRFADGCSPHDYDHELISPLMKAAREKYYIIFPQTDIRKIVNDDTNPPAMLATSEGGLLSVIVIETRSLNFMGVQGSYNATIRYEFNRCMAIEHVKFSSEYGKGRAYLVKKGKLKLQADSVYKKSIIDGFRSWDGDGFVKGVTMNRRYTEMCGAKR